MGKTTLAVNTAFGLAFAGKKTLLVDCDPQANTTVVVIGMQKPKLSMYDLLARDVELAQVVTNSRLKNLDILPSEIDLSGAEVELVGQVGSQTLLRSKFRQGLPKDYDFIVIDTPPSLGILTINGLAASTEVIIPVSISFFALKGIEELRESIELVRTRLDTPQLHISGVVLNLYDYTNVANDVYTAIDEQFGNQTFKNRIPKNIRVEEAHSRGLSVFEHAPKSKGALAYALLVEKVLHG